MGAVESVNISPVRDVVMNGKTVATAIGKMPVATRLALQGVNLAGDDQADRTVHGGPDQAVYAYAAEDYDWWNEQLGRTLAPGTFGENLTLRGIDVNGARVGERWQVGTTLLEVTSPRVPCFKLAHVMDDPHFIRAFAQARRPGAYLRIIDEGTIGAGDAVVVTWRPDHDLTVAEMARIYFFDRANVRQLLVAPALPDAWREWVEEHA